MIFPHNVDLVVSYTSMSIRRTLKEPRDRQRSKAYAFDDWLLKNIPAAKLSLTECHLVVGLCLAHMKFDAERTMPEIKDGRRHRSAMGGPSEIILPRWARSTVIVPHETAHCIAMRILGYPEAHGPEWLRIYLFLVSKLHGVSEAELVKEAKAQGLRVAPAKLIATMRKHISESAAWG